MRTAFTARRASVALACLLAALPALVRAASSATVIDVSDPTVISGSGWSYDANVYTITDGANLTITGTTSTRRVKVAGGATVVLAMENAGIRPTSAGSPLDIIAGATATLTLVGENAISSVGTSAPGIYVPTGATVIIGGTGSLAVGGITYGSMGGATGNSGTIVINSGTITTAGYIGSTGAAITINGGVINAGNMIGGGNSTVVINGGVITASGTGTSPGIGGTGAAISITGGTVTAIGSSYCAGIGAHDGQAPASITITGGVVTATGGNNAAGIGGGRNGGGGVISITGGIITATHGGSALGIGRGSGTSTNTSGAVNGDAVIFSSTALDPRIAHTKGFVFGGVFGSVNGVVTLPGGADIPAGRTLVIPSGASLTVPDGKTLASAGVILVENGGSLATDGSGAIVNDGAIYHEPAAALAGSAPGGSGTLAAVPARAANTIDITTGQNLIGATATPRWSFASAILTLADGSDVIITGTTTVNRVVVASGATAAVTLRDADIRRNTTALDMAGATVALTLEGGNVLKTTYAYSPALRLTSASALTIGGAGSLDAAGTNNPGIGGHDGQASGTITINSGVIRATGGTGIGGGNRGDGGVITINGGEITAIATGGAGIGAGLEKTSATIIINGGTVRATGGVYRDGSAGIGGGCNSAAGTATITINGGVVNATGGGSGAAGIGGGANAVAAASVSVAITGGSITARSSGAGHAIGGGQGDAVASGEITGGAVIFAIDAIDPRITITSYALLGQGDAVVFGADTVTLLTDMVIPAGKTLVIPAGKTLVVPGGITLLNNGVIIIENGGRFDALTGDVLNSGVIFVRTGGTINGSPGGVSWEDVPASGNILDLGAGANLLGATSGGGWSFAGGVFTINDGADVTLTGATAANRVVVASGATAAITLASAGITAPADAPALDMTGATVALTLVGESTLNGGANQPGIRVPVGTALTIDGSGSLAATGGDGGAGIGGGGTGDAGGGITINGGSVTATGGDGGAGIGGGRGSTGGQGGTVVINGGTVAATGGNYGAGIGGGGVGGGTWTSGGKGGSVTINGGSVTAVGNNGGAGIGGGWGNTGAGAGGVVLITDGTVKATAASGAGIGAGSGGNGRFNDGGTITITGGTVTASSDGSAGIGGGGGGGAGGVITITGGTVTASSASGAGIGGSSGHSPAGTINISGDAIINATGNGAAIGSNGTGAGGSINISGNVTITANAGVNSIHAIGRGGAGTAPTGDINVSIPITATKPLDPALTVTKAVAFGWGGGVVANASHTLADDLAVAPAATLTVASGGTLTIPAGKTLSNAGFLVIENGATLDGAGALENTGIILVKTGGTLLLTPGHADAGRLVAEADPGSRDIFNIGTGVNLFGETTGADGKWSFAPATGILTINNGANIAVSGSTTANRIKVVSGATAAVTLENASIVKTIAFDLAGATLVTLTLRGDNTLHGGVGVGGGSLHAFDAHLVIEGPGSLTARNSGDCSGIATNANGSITINGGTITSTGSSRSASAWGTPGIATRGGRVTINGGVIYATGGRSGAGIGGGEAHGGTGIITINGGVVHATSNQYVGLGGSDDGSITITGGIVHVIGGIGRNGGAADVTVTIDGNAVVHTDTPITDAATINLARGVIFTGNSGAVLGAVTLAEDAELPAGKVLVIPSGASLAIAGGKTLVNNGTLLVENGGELVATGAGSIINNGAIYYEPTGAITGGTPGGSGTVAAAPAGAANTIDIATGQNLVGLTYGDGWSFASAILTIKNGAAVVITGTTTANRVVVDGAATAAVTLRDADIRLTNASILDFAGATVALTLEGASILECTQYRSPAIRLTNTSTLTIGGSGTLDATGGTQASGIGCGWNSASGNITINSGVIRATGAVGIGGGYIASSGTITINGGDITAASNSSGAGIGAGNNLATIVINGGTIKATGGGDGAGIGGGGLNGGGALSVTINAGNIIATGGANAIYGIGRGANAAASATVTGEINAPASVIFTSSVPDPDITLTDYALLGPVGPGATSFTPSGDPTVPDGQTVLIPAGYTVTVSAGVTLENNGTIIIAAGGALTVATGGAIVNNGVIYREATGSLTGAAPSGDGKVVAIADGMAGDIVDIGTGRNLFGEVSGAGGKWSFVSPILTINDGAAVTITGTTTANRVVVTSGATASVTLLDADIQTNSNSFNPLSLAGATVALTLEGDNVLKNLGQDAAALRVGAGASLTIGGTGSLSAACTGGYQASSGIGGNRDESGGAITINSGTINASGATGIGGGQAGEGGTITINGGHITAAGTTVSGAGGGAGIGAGWTRTAATIVINGGTVTATGGAYGNGSAGIGGGVNGDAGALSVTVTGGVVNATGRGTASGIGLGGNTNAAATVTGAIAGGAIVIADPGIDSRIAQTGGLIFEGGIGDIVGDAITLSADIALPSGAALLIGAGQTLTIAPGVTFTNNGTIYIETGGALVNNGAVVNNGGVFNIGGAISGSGTFGGNPVNPPERARPPASTIACGFVHSAFAAGGKAYTAGLYAGSLTRSIPGEVALPEGTVVTSVAASGANTLFLTSEGKVYSDGDGNYSAVPGSLTTPVVFADMGAGVVITAIAGSANNNWGNTSFTLYLDSEGRVHACGYNGYGQLGIGTTTEQQVGPKRVLLPEGARIKAIAAGHTHSLFLAEDGTVYAAGRNSSGQLGIGPMDNQSTPVAVDLTGLPAGVSIIAIAAGEEHSLFLGSNGVVYATGRNNEGQLANGSTAATNRLAATRILSVLPGGVTVTAIAAGNHYSLFLGSNGRVYGAGLNNNGQLGDGTGTNRSTPVEALLPDGAAITAIAGGYAHSLFLADDGTFYAAGYNLYGGLGVGSLLQGHSTPVTRVATPVFTTAGIAAGWRFSYFLAADGNVYAAGEHNALGAGVTVNQFTPVEVLLPDGVTITNAAGGDYHGLFLTTDGRVFATGNNGYGQLGVGTTTNRAAPVEVLLPAGVVITDVVGWGNDSLFLTADGKVYAAGRNNYGQLGVGNGSAQTTPVRVVALDAHAITAIAAGSAHGLFLAGDGRVFAAGYNGSGELGDGTTTQSVWPVAVDLSNLPAGVTVTAVAAGGGTGSAHSLFLGSNGKVYACGANNNGQLGIGSTANQHKPVEVDLSGVLPEGVTITAIAAGGFHSLFLGSNGRVYACGYNNSGRLGDGTATNRTTPVAVALPEGAVITAIAGGGEHSLFLGADGTVYGAGVGAYGHLGNGASGNVITPATLLPETITVDQPVLSEPVDIAAIGGVTPPVKDATAVAETEQYTGVVAWSPALVDGKFAPDTAYTATITLAPKPGHTFIGVAANFFTVAGSTGATNAANSGIVTAAFPATEKAALSGSVSLSGSAIYGSTLTADTSALTSSPVIADLGTLTYVWKRNGAETITGASSATYTLTVADIGKTLTVTITAANCSGSMTSSATSAVAKVAQTAPAAPVLASKTAASITLSTITGAEYRQGASGSWQDSTAFTGLTPDTAYTFYARLKETTTHSASPASAASASITTDKATLAGSVSLTGGAIYGSTLTAVTTALTSSPVIANLGTLTYVWKRNGTETISGATSATYALTVTDIGSTITVTVTAANCSGSVISPATAAVAKAAQTAPAAPALASKTAASITLATITGAEYRQGAGGSWQDSAAFTGLTPNTAYTFHARLKETTTHSASPASAASASITTDKAALSGSVTLTGSAIYGSTLTAVTTALTSSPVIADLGTLTYVWKRNGTETISGANSATYTLAAADIGKTITVTVTAANCNGSATSAATAAVAKAAQTAPAAPTLASKTATSITLATITGAEYSRSTSGPWQDSTAFTGLAAGSSYTFYARLKETTTHSASPASAGATIGIDAPVITITTQPAAQTGVTQGSITGALSVAASVTQGATLNYQWYSNTTASSSGGASIGGATGASFSIPTTLASGTYYYFCELTATAATAVRSTAATVTVAALPPVVTGVTVTPATASVEKGATQSFTATVSGSNTPPQTVTWSVTGGGAGTDISASGLLTVAAGESAATLIVRATSTFDTSKSGAATVTVTEPATTPSGLRPLVAQQVVTVGKSVRFTGSADGHPQPAFHWQVSVNGAAWSNLANGGVYSGANTAALTITGVTAAMDGYRYRYVATNSAGSAESNAATLKVIAVVFPSPAALTLDNARALYVADAGAHTLHKVTPQFSATLFAGAPNQSGAANATGTSARFNQPSALAFNKTSGELLVADKGGQAIRKVTAAGIVTTLAAGFSQPSGVALDASGLAYVTDAGAHTLSAVTSTGSVTPYAGLSGTSGAVAGIGALARFNAPSGVAIDSVGELYVADTGNHVIRTEAADGSMLLYAGLAGAPGDTDGPAPDARLNKPQGMASDSAGHIYFADTGNHTVRILTAGGEVLTLAGAPGVSGLSDGAGTNALFSRPSDVALDGNGVLYVADTGNALIRKITFTGTQFADAQVSALLITSATVSGSTGGGDGGGGDKPKKSGGGGALTLPALLLLSAMLIVRRVKWER